MLLYDVAPALPTGEVVSSLAVVFFVGYLLGSIPFGVIAARLWGLGDLRKQGSGNIGATNVLRAGSKVAALLTLIGDGGKGAVAVLLARTFGGIGMGMVAGLGAFLGHLFPVWLNFKGGKGVATFLGIMLGLDWRAGALACATWLLVAGLTRYSSLAALVAAALAPIYLWLFERSFFAAVPIFLAVLVFITHRANIARLLAGTEPKIGARPPSQAKSQDAGISG
jgi:glycerol-3-phosphate acyltransferase PlsY